eukprot:TRINITY_DN59750_c0_g1_i1.p1 TRINITY_DN59750_c0_g1~~TRINITY_DN59750_c0_g1_i1.p1  ORF type:complete len:542 (-),score=65.96 TRINITY_DN59750_c0_g1_i1:163-1788(-)
MGRSPERDRDRFSERERRHKRRRRYSSDSSSDGSREYRRNRQKRTRQTAWDGGLSLSGAPTTTTSATSEIDAAIAAAAMTLTNPTLNTRVYVGNIFYDVGEDELKHVFGRCGFVTNVQLMMDPETGRHKGFAFVEYDSNEAAEKALQQLDGYSFAGRQLRVGRPHNPQATVKQPGMHAQAVFTPAAPAEDPVAREFNCPSVQGIKYGAPGEPKPPPNYPLKGQPKVYVINVHEGNDLILQALFAKYGNVKALKLEVDPGRTQKKYCVVEYDSSSSAEAAVKGLDEHQFNGHQWRVGRVLPSPITNLGQSSQQNAQATPMGGLGMAAAAQQPQFGGMGGSGFGMMGTAMVVPQIPVLPGIRPDESISTEENVNISGGAARVSLMQKLLRSEEKGSLKVPTATLNERGQPISERAAMEMQQRAHLQQMQQAAAAATVIPTLQSQTAPSKCIVLENLVGSPDEVDSELGGEVKDECSRFGNIAHVLIYDEKDKQGKIHVKFFVLYTAVAEAARCCAKMDGRFFAKRRVSCKYFNEQVFWTLLNS